MVRWSNTAPMWLYSITSLGLKEAENNRARSSVAVHRFASYLTSSRNLSSSNAGNCESLQKKEINEDSTVLKGKQHNLK